MLSWETAGNFTVNLFVVIETEKQINDTNSDTDGVIS